VKLVDYLRSDWFAKMQMCRRGGRDESEIEEVVFMVEQALFFRRSHSKIEV